MTVSAETLGGALSLRARDTIAAPEGAAIPRRADGLELLGEVAGSGYRRAPALVRRADGQTIQLTPLLYRLLEAVDGARDYDELATVFGERVGRLATADDVRYLVETKLRPLGVLRQPDGSEPLVQKANPLLGLRFKLVVSNAETTRRLTAPFAWLFRPPVVLAVVVAFAATTWWMAFDKGLASAARQAIYEPELLLLVFALTLLSAGFHELGHAAACRYADGRPGAMGVGLYLVWPAFYTDVSDSYRLARADRLRVDLGGLYFNTIFGLAILALWAAVGWDALLLVFAAQLLVMVRQLVPIVRFDGYHILADLTGVPDLFAHIKPTLLGLLPTRWGRADGRALKAWARAVVTAWVLVVVPLLAGVLLLVVLVLPRIVATAWDSLGLQSNALDAGWAQSDAAAVVLALLSMLLICLPVLGIGYLLARIGLRTARGVWRATAGRPPLRVATVLAATLLGVLVVSAWWPDGQYRPIQAREDGTLSVPHLVGVAVPTAIRVPAPKTTPAPAATAAPEPSRAARGRWMLVLVPERAASGTTTTAPTVVYEVPTEAVPGREPTAPPVVPTEQPAAEPAAAAAPPELGWVFPFAHPRAPEEGDNQALAVNTQNGARSFDMKLALVWVTDGSTVDQRNEAYALARCTGCQTTAVAFQVVLIVGRAKVVKPINSAVAVNYECERCATQALALQLVATLARAPSEQTTRELESLWADLEERSKAFELKPLAEVQTDLLTTRTRVLEILAREQATAASEPAPAQAEATGRDESTSETATTAETTTTPAPAATTTTTTTTTAPAETTTTTAAEEEEPPPAETTTTAPEEEEPPPGG